MADPVYLFMGYSVHYGWSTMRAFTTKMSAIGAAMELIANSKSSSGMPGLRVFETCAVRDLRKPQHFPGRFLAGWSARSVGGIGGNPWSNIAVAELDVEDDVLGRLAEIGI